jgi:hypothetical protein
MERAGAIAEKLFPKDGVIAVTVYLCKTLLRYASLPACLLHHLFCKNKLVPPIEVRL